MELTNQIIAKMKAEGATSASTSEINRCLSQCVSSKKLIEFALSNRLKFCKSFCAWQECSDGEIHSDCDCDAQLN